MTASDPQISPETRVKLTAREFLGGIGIIVLVVLAIGGAWWTLQAHTADKIRHLDAEKVADRGGPILREDLRDAQKAITQQISDTEQRIVRTVEERGRAPIQLRGCKSGPNGSIICRLETP